VLSLTENQVGLNRCFRGAGFFGADSEANVESVVAVVVLGHGGYAVMAIEGGPGIADDGLVAPLFGAADIANRSTQWRFCGARLTAPVVFVF
jgi:hypothetical protein